jgi:hypothetical protein
MPSTPAKIDDNWIIPFGAHKGRRIGAVPAHYLNYIIDMDFVKRSYPEIIRYVSDNRSAIDAELHESGDLFPDD